MEYLRAIVEAENIDVDKIWREIIDTGEKRYVRCLVFSYNSKTYLIDTVDKFIKDVNLEELDKKIYIFKPEEHEYSYYGG